MGSLIIWVIALGFGSIFLILRLRGKRKAGEGHEFELGGAWFIVIIISILLLAYSLRHFLGEDFIENHQIIIVIITIVGFIIIFEIAGLIVYGKKSKDDKT